MKEAVEEATYRVAVEIQGVVKHFTTKAASSGKAVTEIREYLEKEQKITTYYILDVDACKFAE